jgi:biopolymer transport protein ExbB
MKELFVKGGLIMWPILVVSLIAVTTVIERIFFALMESGRRQPRVVRDIFFHLEHRDPESAIKIGEGSKDFVARTLVAGLKERDTSFTNALLWRSSEELRRYNRGLSTLDTVITLSPLLGLLGTVTGMIGAFSILGKAELSAPTAITGGIAEALIATAFGLGVAIIALVPYNYLNARLEAARREIEIAGNRLELLLIKMAAEKTEEQPPAFARS